MLLLVPPAGAFTLQSVAFTLQFGPSSVLVELLEVLLGVGTSSGIHPCSNSLRCPILSGSAVQPLPRSVVSSVGRIGRGFALAPVKQALSILLQVLLRP